MRTHTAEPAARCPDVGHWHSSGRGRGGAPPGSGCRGRRPGSPTRSGVHRPRHRERRTEPLPGHRPAGIPVRGFGPEPSRFRRWACCKSCGPVGRHVLPRGDGAACERAGWRPAPRVRAGGHLRSPLSGLFWCPPCGLRRAASNCPPSRWPLHRPEPIADRRRCRLHQYRRA